MHATNNRICIPVGQRKGFTLFEMAIVLVIITLVIGAIMLGDALVETAEIRSFVSQIERYKTSVTTFRVKFNAIPGDITARDAAAVGLVARSGTAGRGDGNTILTPGNAFGWLPLQCGETILFWNDLSTAGLIDGGYGGPDASPCLPADVVATAIVPQARIGDMSVVVVYGDTSTGKNYFSVHGNVTSINSNGLLNSHAHTLTPMQAYNIDLKVDDGLPFAGTVTARDASDIAVPVTALVAAAAPARDVCVSNATGNPYNISKSTGANTIACTIRIPIN